MVGRSLITCAVGWELQWGIWIFGRKKIHSTCIVKNSVSWKLQIHSPWRNKSRVAYMYFFLKSPYSPATSTFQTGSLERKTKWRDLSSHHGLTSGLGCITYESPVHYETIESRLLPFPFTIMVKKGALWIDVTTSCNTCWAMVCRISFWMSEAIYLSVFSTKWWSFHHLHLTISSVEENWSQTWSMNPKFACFILPIWESILHESKISIWWPLQLLFWMNTSTSEAQYDILIFWSIHWPVWSG